MFYMQGRFCKFDVVLDGKAEFAGKFSKVSFRFGRKGFVTKGFQLGAKWFNCLFG